MTQRYDVMTGRKYADRDGNEKTAWTKVGTMFANRSGDGFSIALDALPIPTLNDGKLECRMVCFPPRDRDDQRDTGRGAETGQRGGSGAGRQRQDDLDDDLPF